MREVLESPFRTLYEVQLRYERPNLYRQLQETGELSRHLHDVCRIADQEFDVIFARLVEENPEPIASLGKGNHLWMLASQAQEMVLDSIPIGDDEAVSDFRRNDGHRLNG